MSQGKITEKQKEILEYIKETILSKGYPPAVREICEAVHLKSTSSVHSHLESLEKNGYIRRDPTKPRTIEILDDDFALTRREVVNVPIVGTVAAGTPILAQENIEEYFPIPVEMLPNKEIFMLRVKGDKALLLRTLYAFLHAFPLRLGRIQKVLVVLTKAHGLLNGAEIQRVAAVVVVDKQLFP